MELAVTVVVAIAMIIGIVGTILPVLPGLPVVWVAALGFGLYEGFDLTGWIAFSIITVLTIVGLVGSVVLPARQAGAAGAAKTSVALGFVGALVLSFPLNLIGVVLGGVLGIYAGERLRGVAHQQAVDATIATLKGMGWAVVAQFTAAITAFATWILWALLT